MKFKILKQSKRTLARKGVIETSHGKIQTPVFMPCATQGAVKGISPGELKEIGFEIILSNTYHLFLRPGEKEIKKLGGLQKFTNWNGPMLTDSGGYQIFSLGENFRDYNEEEKAQATLVNVKPDGVWFKSHLDGSKKFFAPEKVLEIQKDLGADIIMVLDECTEHPASHKRARESMEMTHHWAKRSIEYWEKFGPSPSGTASSGQALFGIVQGSVYKDLREQSVKYLTTLDFDGIAVGGVSVGEGKIHMYEVMRWVGPLLPQNKPHYLMGVGEPEDIIEAVRWGFDMFDCVLPTRLARHGTVWITSNFRKFQKIDLRKSEYRSDEKPIMKNCGCPTCNQSFSRAYISHLIREKEMLGMRLATLHNLYIIHQLMYNLRQ